ncbi:uracil-DNA glycosylase [Shewanella litorisediminis]|uniref:Uracil-DNA glycosylase n=1 Tax=Shewanella litorisediminis TaxID=1173586 RepID=A0ABX7G6M0_9GAMM|nr:uracil-DNA glycosylase [Shewanella litorisediminis]MCL2916867.1 uracil-DNA glycosylase [Shewanella litorisediminis]QRH02965.1 uracil-DNA glycosylase [Shewanella litorisediminis]
MDWQQLLGDEKRAPYFQDTLKYVDERIRAGVTVYPPKAEVFNAFRFTPLEQVKVVILGQDPYHSPNQAHGLCFSVKSPCPPPPSLQNIFRELASSIPGFITPSHGDLSHWAYQGVLLLNTVLTVERGQAHSHAHLGWEQFTDAVIRGISTHCQGVIFLLWGSHAGKKSGLIDSNRHRVLRAPHPSPLSAHRGFFGCNHFAQTNDVLQRQGKTAIDWRL